MSVTISVSVAGQLVPGSAADTVSPEGLHAGDTLDVIWGRDDTTGQPDASSCEFRLIRPAPVDWLRVGADVLVSAVSPGHPSAAVFLGSITSLTLSWDPDLGVPVVDVIADDVLADLGNRRVASSPWPREALADRVDRVMFAARQDVPYTVDPTLGGTTVAKQDVDTLMATEVLQGLAASVDGILWSTVATHFGSWAPALRLEDPAQRPPLRRLAKPAGLIVIVFDADALAAVAITLDACVFDRDPVQFVQNVDDIVTGVAVTYYTPDPDPTAADVANTVDVVDRGAESPSGGWGVRRIDLDTQLTNAVDAQAVGDKILGRLRPKGAWRAPGLSFDKATTKAITDVQLLALLDLAHRSGQALVVPLPAWAPNAEPLIGYLEGGHATYFAGAWALELTVASALAYGAADVRWVDMPDLSDWIWNNWDPAITWDDLAGVGPPVGVVT